MHYSRLNPTADSGVLSYQFEEGFHRKPCLFKDVRKGGSFDWTVRRYRQLQGFILHMFMEAYMRSFLAKYNPSISFKSGNQKLINIIAWFLNADPTKT
jgi:hypothetical protein